MSDPIEVKGKDTEATASSTTGAAYADALDWDTRETHYKTIVLKNEDGANSLYYKVLVYAHYTSGNSYEQVAETSLSSGDTVKIVLNDKYARVKVQVKNNSGAADYQIDSIHDTMGA